MRLSRKGELALVEKVRERFKAPGRSVVLGIGDDAAVLRPAAGLLLATTDMMVEGVHFDLRLATPFQIGFKLVSVNVSDIYAMGGAPAHALLGLALPADTREDFMDGFLSGVEEAAGLYGVSVVGGDVSSSPGGMALSATVLGRAARPVKRSGARPGDGVFVTGTLGDSACGIALLRAIGKRVDFSRPVNRPLRWRVMEPLLKRHLIPVARKPSRYLRAATAMIDVSDGLALDLHRLCAESGVGARVYKGDVPISAGALEAARRLGLDPFALASSGGEDYELLFTARSAKVAGARRIGEVTPGAGMVLVDEKGGERPLRPAGYLHFGG
ncbi:MAG: thiamine-phosphate kinase [Thermodesulfovibrionales bacterium]